MENFLLNAFDIGRLVIQIVVAFGIVIFLHELGHFLMAKIVGVGATEFALGMGPALFGFQWGETYCKLCAFPIGGYVKLIGEEDDDVPVHLRHKSLRVKPTWAKISVIFAGPFMNFVLALILLIGIPLIWGVSRTLPVEYSALEPYIQKDSAVVASYVVDPRKPAGDAGVKKDDTIVAVNGEPVRNVAHFEQLMQENGGESVTLTLKRDFKTLKKTFKPRKTRVRTPEQWLIGVMAAPDERTLKVRKVTPDSPADKAGIRAGDILVSIDGEKLRHIGQLHALIQKGEDKAHEFVVERDGKTDKKTITPAHQPGVMQTRWEHGIFPSIPTPRQVKSVTPESPAAKAGLKAGDIILDFDRQEYEKKNTYNANENPTRITMYRRGEEPRKLEIAATPGADIGLTLYPVNRRVGLGEAVALGVESGGNLFTGFFKGIRQLVTREVSTDEIAGPVGIMQYASTFARNGLRDFISFFAFISLCLAIINLVPFPALDGAHIVFFLWEGVTGRPLNAERQNLINYVGFCILIGLIIIVTFRDLRLWIGF
jgi:regulator of sigma E protease